MKGILITLGVTLILIILIVFLYNPSQQNNITYFNNTEVACLRNGHQNVTEHIHPELKITVDGNPETIPANVGTAPNCMSELHTHDETGVIHAESFATDRIADFNLRHFFEVWGQNPEREGFSLEIKQDGEIKNSVEEVKYIDHSIIELTYTTQNKTE